MTVNVRSVTGGCVFDAAEDIQSTAGTVIGNTAGVEHTVSAPSVTHSAAASLKLLSSTMQHIGMVKNLLAGGPSGIASMLGLNDMMSSVTSAFGGLSSLTSGLSSITSSLSSISSITSSLGSITSLTSSLGQFSSLASSLSGMVSGGSSGGGSVGDLQSGQQTQTAAIQQLVGASQTFSSLSTTALFSGGISPYADVHTNLENLASVLTKAFLASSTTKITVAGSGFASGQTVTLTVTDASLSGGTHNVTYLSVPGDTTAAKFATGLFNSINSDPVVNGFLVATNPSSGVVQIVSTSGIVTTYSGSSSGGSETYTPGTPTNVNGPNFSQTVSNNDDAVNTIMGVLNTALVLADLGAQLSQPGSTATVSQLKAVMTDIGTILSNSDFTNAVSTLSTANSTIAALATSIKVDVDAVNTALVALP